MEIMEYKNLEWYIINETDKEKLLFLKDCFTNEQIMKYFLDKSMMDKDYEIKFNKKNSPWFRDSYIREALNTVFLSYLDISDLNEMETIVSLDGQSVITKDYVRLITKEEVEKLPKEVLKTVRKYGYWTMTPYFFDSHNSYMFSVAGAHNPGGLVYYNIYSTYSVRPVVSLKSETLKSGIMGSAEGFERERINELVRSIREKIQR